MALADMLSAMRAMILNWDEIPDDKSLKFEKLSKEFPGLTKLEQDDLANIPPQKLKIYRSTILTGESTIFLNHFKITMPILIEGWEKVRAVKFNRVTFARLIHKFKPWKSQKTNDLLNNFVSYLESECKDILEEYPFLIELADLEKRTVILKRAVNPTFKAISSNEISSMKVEELLNLKIFLLPSVGITKYTYNIVESFNQFHTDSSKKVSCPARMETYALGFRSNQMVVYWKSITKNLYHALNKLDHEKETTVSDFFDSLILDIENENKNKEEFFADLMNTLVSALSSPVIALTS